MTTDKTKDILNLSDTIKGEINIMCATDDIFKMHDMASYARAHITDLEDLIHDAKFTIER